MLGGRRGRLWKWCVCNLVFPALHWWPIRPMGGWSAWHGAPTVSGLPPFSSLDSVLFRLYLSLTWILRWLLFYRTLGFYSHESNGANLGTRSWNPGSISLWTEKGTKVGTTIQVAMAKKPTQPGKIKKTDARKVPSLNISYNHRYWPPLNLKELITLPIPNPLNSTKFSWNCHLHHLTSHKRQLPCSVFVFWG